VIRLTVHNRHGTPVGADLRRSPLTPHRFVVTSPSADGTLKPNNQRRREAAMATVYVLTAGSGDSYRIERVYLDSDQAYGFAQDYNGIAPVEPVQVEEWLDGAPPSVYDGPYWRAEWWARMPVAKRRSALRHTDEGERFDDFAIRQEWWTGDALPEATVVRRELTGVPKVEVVGRSKEKVEEIFWEAVTQVRADLAGVPRK
jgi:hypothetical protein